MILEVLTGKNKGRQITVPASGAVLGRGADCDVTLDEPTLFRRHCCFTFENGDWVIEDLGRRSGVIINGQKSRESPLKQGDAIKLAGVVLKVVSLPLPQVVPAQETIRLPSDSALVLLTTGKPGLMSGNTFLPLGCDKNEFLKGFGSPEERQQLNATQPIFRYSYKRKGVIVTVNEESEALEAFLVFMRQHKHCQAADARTDRGIRGGASVADVIAKYGEPSRRSMNALFDGLRLVYVADTCGVCFEFDGDKLAAIGVTYARSSSDVPAQATANQMVGEASQRVFNANVEQRKITYELKAIDKTT
jgi:pSer/pThr/pTyr-binding forkhead associated (FHA) protein